MHVVIGHYTPAGYYVVTSFICVGVVCTEFVNLDLSVYLMDSTGIYFILGLTHTK